MKPLFKVIFTFVVILSGVFFSCSDNSTDPKPLEPIKNYFPNTEGSVYVYDFEISDSLGSVVNVERQSTYSGSVALNSKSYQLLIDQFTFPTFSTVDTSYFRKIDEGILFFSDNSQAMMLIPDSLRSLIQADEEAKLIGLPIILNEKWQAYNLGLNYGFIVFNIINVLATPEILENISLTVNQSAFNKEAVKIKYTMSITVGVGQPSLTYTAYAWMVDGVGLVKLEGDSEAINFMVGSNLFLPGSHIKQTLKQYSIP